MKPKLKLPGTQRLKLKCDDPLSIFAFKFNFRRFTTAETTTALASVGRCRLTSGAYTRPLFGSTEPLMTSKLHEPTEHIPQECSR